MWNSDLSYTFKSTKGSDVTYQKDLQSWVGWNSTSLELIGLKWTSMLQKQTPALIY